MELRLPPDWEQYPELVQALQVLVEGAARALRGRSRTEESMKTALESGEHEDR